eukprot:GILK01006250.1.p1 GENE.GILK01006250.1~~GILK01006250.1.p1  ORF type:complete len:448 (-),score=45.32 GILK01006250.1:550-1860(-)
MDDRRRRFVLMSFPLDPQQKLREQQLHYALTVLLHKKKSTEKAAKSTAVIDTRVIPLLFEWLEFPDALSLLACNREIKLIFKNPVRGYYGEIRNLVCCPNITRCLPAVRRIRLGGKWRDDDFARLTEVQELEIRFPVMIGAQAFLGLRSLRSLTLRYDKPFPAMGLGSLLSTEQLSWAPHLRVLKIGASIQITDAHLCSFVALEELRIPHQQKVTDAAFQQFTKLRVLDISHCPLITDAAFSHFKGIHVLLMENCGSGRLTDVALSHLQGVKKLDVTDCDGLTDAAFQYVRGVEYLKISRCSKLTDMAIAPLEGSIRFLEMKGCCKITDRAFAYLQNTIRVLDVSDCPDTPITANALQYLGGLEKLILLCSFFTKAVSSRHLTNLRHLILCPCHNKGLLMYRQAFLETIQKVELCMPVDYIGRDALELRQIRFEFD